MIKNSKISAKIFFEKTQKNIKISEERVLLLKKIALKITKELIDRGTINLNFICTHNSRRSQMGQIWAFYASEYFNLQNIFCFSGGTEVTAFHRNTIKTLQKTGFRFNIIDFSHQNPKYLIDFDKSSKKIIGFSKKFDSEENKHPYIAITTCNNAEENCLFIPDAIERFHLPFADPKITDNTPLKDDKHLETNKQIAGEIFIIFKEISKQITTQ